MVSIYVHVYNNDNMPYYAGRGAKVPSGKGLLYRLLHHLKSRCWDVPKNLAWFWSLRSITLIWYTPYKLTRMRATTMSTKPDTSFSSRDLFSFPEKMSHNVTNNPWTYDSKRLSQLSQKRRSLVLQCWEYQYSIIFLIVVCKWRGRVSFKLISFLSDPFCLVNRGARISAGLWKKDMFNRWVEEMEKALPK